MSRKSCYVQQIKASDIQALNHFRCTAIMSEKELYSYLSKNRIKAYKNEKLIEKIQLIDSSGKGKNKIAFSITEKGKRFIQGNIPELRDRQFYASNINAVNHNLVLSEQFSKLSDNEKMSWLVEGEIRDRFDELYKNEWNYDTLRDNLSVTDGMYVNDSGADICMEVVTSNYTSETISQKENCANMLDAEYQQFRA